MIKSLIVILILLVAGGYLVYRDPDSRAWLVRETQHVLPKSATEQTLYRWRDQHGEWQVSDKPPTGGITYQTVRYPTNANVIPSSELTGKK